MAQNYAEKYSSKVDEKFRLASLTDAAVNKDYDFVGVKTVHVYSLQTVAPTDYTMTGTDRFGTPKEMDDTVQELTMSQDKSFTFVIDAKNMADSAGAKKAGAALTREIEEQIVPMIDKFRLAAAVTGAGNKTVAAAITKDNAYEKFLEAEALLADDMVPTTNRVAFVSPKFYSAIKRDPSFVLASDVAQNKLITGSLGMVDGVNIIMVPTSYLPSTVEFVVMHKSAMTSPVKLATYRVLENQRGIDGAIIEGRIYYDAFVLKNKANGICVHKNA